MSEQQPCPSCGGHKQGPAMVRFADGTCQLQVVTCDRCKGVGTVPREMYDWMERGRAMRQDRVSRRVSLREEAARLGTDAMTLSAMERGLIEPPREVQA